MRAAAALAVLVLALAGCAGPEAGRDRGTAAPTEGSTAPAPGGTGGSVRGGPNGTGAPGGAGEGGEAGAPSPRGQEPIDWNATAAEPWGTADFDLVGDAGEWAWVWQPFPEPVQEFRGGGRIRLEASGDGPVTAMASHVTTVKRWESDGRLDDTFAFFETTRAEGRAAIESDRTGNTHSCGGCAYIGFYALVGADAPWRAAIDYELGGDQEELLAPERTVRGQGVRTVAFEHVSLAPVGVLDLFDQGVLVDGTAVAGLRLPEARGFGNLTLAVPGTGGYRAFLFGAPAMVSLGQAGHAGAVRLRVSWTGAPYTLDAWVVEAPGAGNWLPAPFGKGWAVQG